MSTNSSLVTRLKILILPGIIPFPPSDGGKLCIFGFIDYLRRYHDIHLLLIAYNDLQKKEIERLKLDWHDVLIDHIDLYKPSGKNSKKQTIIKIGKNLLKSGVQFFKGKRNVEIANPYEWYDIFQTTPFYPHTLNFIQKLTNIISNSKFDIIQTELTWMLNLVYLFPSDVKKVFVQIENRGDILNDYGVANNIDGDYLKYIVSNTEFLEYSYMSRYDAIFALSDYDKKRLKKNLPEVKVYDSPFGILNRDLIAWDFNLYSSENLIFIGSESHYPNLDGIRWFLADIIKLLDDRPFKKLFITGNWKEETMAQLSAYDDCVEFIGFVEDLSPYLKNSVSIVPIRIGGGGIRTKILFAMSKGSPVITTPMAAVGVSDKDNIELMIADSAEEFASSIKQLFEDDKKARSIIFNAFNLIQNNFSQSIVSEKRNQFYLELTGHVAATTGEILFQK